MTAAGIRACRFLAGLVVISFLFSTWWTGFNPVDVFMNLGGVWTFLTEDFLPPKMPIYEVLTGGLVVTVALAMSATSIGAVFALFAAVLGSDSMTPSRGLSVLIRGFATFLRNIPTLVWAFILFSSLGIGTGVGFVALFITSFAFMTRTFIEVIDEIPKDSFEALTAVGATFFQKVFQLVLPCCVEGFISWYLYSLEVNIRASTVVGMVGGGGIGMVLLTYLKQFQYPQAAGAILAMAVIVILVDWITGILREKVMHRE